MNTSSAIPAPIDLYVFQAMPGNSALLLPDAPRFTIVAVTDSYAQTSNRSREELVGKGLFEAFPNASGDAEKKSEQVLRASLVYALHHRELHKLPLHRYDIPNPDGSFDERYWSAVNKPVTDKSGKVLYIIHSAEDVTLQVKAAQKAAALDSVERVFSQFMHAPFVVGMVRGDQHVLEMANEAALQLWGRGPEIIGKPLLQSLPELEGQGVLELFDWVKRTGQVYEGKAVPVMSMGSGQPQIHYFDLVYQPYFEEGNPAPTGVFTISYDVTDQVHARRLTEANEKRFRALVTATANVVYRFSADGSEIQTLFQEDRGAGNNQPLAQWLQQQVQEHDRQQVAVAIRQAIAATGPFEVEYRLQQPGDAPRWAFLRAVPILNKSGQIVEWFGAATDITRRKQTEAALQATREAVERQKRLYETIADNTPDLIYVFDPGYRFTYANKALLDMWGKTAGEAIGKGLLENGYEPWHAEMHQREIDQVVATRQPIRGEVSFPHATLGKRVYDYIFVPVLGDNGQVEAIAGTTRDITEIKQAEEVLRQGSEKLEALVAERTRELQRSNAELEGFAYAASHDLKEPVRKIHFFADRLKQQLAEQLSPEQAMIFGRLENAASRMGALIDDLLDYSHAARGAGDQEAVDLNRKVQLVLEDLEVEIQQKNAVIEVGPMPAIRGNRRQLQQMFYNLLTNGLKYNKPGEPPQVRIGSQTVRGNAFSKRLPQEAAEKLFHLITVQDQGIGFRQEDAERIFTVFTRLHGNAEYKGSGVGLSIARKVAESHGGSIWAESEPGKGATFRILLPVNL